MAQRRIKWGLNRPRKSHLGRKLEQVQQTALDELYATLGVDHLDDQQLRHEIEHWREFHIGSPPMHKLLDVESVIPGHEEVATGYNRNAEEGMPTQRNFPSHQDGWNVGQGSCDRCPLLLAA